MVIRLLPRISSAAKNSCTCSDNRDLFKCPIRAELALQGQGERNTHCRANRGPGQRPGHLLHALQRSGHQYHCLLKHIRSKMHEISQNHTSLPSISLKLSPADDQRSHGIEPKSQLIDEPPLAANTFQFMQFSSKTVVFGDCVEATVESVRPTACNGFSKHEVFGVEAAIHPSFLLSQPNPSEVVHTTRTLFNAFSKNISSTYIPYPESGLQRLYQSRCRDKPRLWYYLGQKLLA